MPNIFYQKVLDFNLYQIKIITDGLVTASNIFDYCWSDNDFKQKQIERLSR